MKKGGIISKIGHFMKNVEDEHDKEYKFMFHLNHNTFFQKLVPTDVIENGLEVTPDDYLKSLVFLDYMLNVVGDGKEIVDGAKAIYEVIKKEKLGPRLDLGVIVLHSGLSVKQKIIKEGRNYLTDQKSLREIEKRYVKRDRKVDFNSKNLRKMEPYYNAIGLMIYRLVSDENKDGLYDIDSKSDLKALIFTDSILPYLKKRKTRTKILKSLKDGNYFAASIAAIDGLQEEVTLESLEKYLVKMSEKYEK